MGTGEGRGEIAEQIEGIGGAIERSIYTIRGERVILDADLALLYGIETRSLNQAVRRNLDRFPPDFMLVLTPEEVTGLRSQIVISKKGRGGARFAPCAFTAQGVAMLSSVLHSPRASSSRRWRFAA